MSDELDSALGFAAYSPNCDNRFRLTGTALATAIAGLVIAVVLTFSGLAAAQAGDKADAKKILVIYGNESGLPAVESAAKGLSEFLQKKLGNRYDLYVEYLDLVRFPSAGRQRLLVDELGLKYASTQPDVVIAGGEHALNFVLAHRDEFVPHVPVIFGSVGPEALKALSVPPDVKGLVNQVDVLKTLELARKLQPNAKKVVVVTGSGPYDRHSEDLARRQLGSAGIDAQYISGLTLEGFEKAVSALPSNAIVIVLTIYRDASGQRIVPAYATTQIAKASAAPVYSVYDTTIGRGIVGGVVEPFEEVGREMARLAVKSMEDPASVPSVTLAQPRNVVDWRQLKRWNIPEARLPLSTEVRHKELSLFERYRWQISALVVLLLLKTAAIIALVVERSARHKAQKQLMEERMALEHSARATQLGELSGAFAHELNQPLTSILANAEAGAKLLQQDEPDYAEIREIMNDIVDNTNRSADFIRNLRNLFSKGEFSGEIFDLNIAIESVIRLTRSAVLTSGARISFKKEKSELQVCASMVQIQHVILNLIVNAVDAMSDTSTSRRAIVVVSRLREDDFRELSVEDNGPGLTREMMTKAFKPFVTTKTEGLGLGLAICHTIVTAHRGTLTFDANRKVGARVILTLPPPPGGTHGSSAADLPG